MKAMANKKYRIKKNGSRFFVFNDHGTLVFKSRRHSPIKRDKHPYLTGFSKIADFGESYEELLKRIEEQDSSNRIRRYWENVGTYALNVMAENG